MSVPAAVVAMRASLPHHLRGEIFVILLRGDIFVIFAEDDIFDINDFVN